MSMVSFAVLLNCPSGRHLLGLATTIQLNRHCDMEVTRPPTDLPAAPPPSILQMKAFGVLTLR